jgi:hypothetical protein
MIAMAPKIKESQKKKDLWIVCLTMFNQEESTEKKADWWNSSEENIRFLFFDF